MARFEMAYGITRRVERLVLGDSLVDIDPKKVDHYKLLVRRLFWVLPVILAAAQWHLHTIQQIEAQNMLPFVRPPIVTESAVEVSWSGDSQRSQQVIRPVPGRQVHLSDLLPVAQGFKHSAKPLYEFRRGTGDYDKLPYIKSELLVMLPIGTTKEKIAANLIAVARAELDKYPGLRVIDVRLFPRGADTVSPRGHLPPAIASLHFAPFGDMERTDRQYVLHSYTTEITYW